MRTANYTITMRDDVDHDDVKSQETIVLKYYRKYEIARSTEKEIKFRRNDNKKNHSLHACECECVD